MKFQLVSDIHLEFGHTVHIHNAGADVLVLAGDICMARAFKNPDRNISNLGYYHFFDEVCKNFRSVVYVLGNHEHYKGTFNDSVNLLKAALADYDNLHILDNEWVTKIKNNKDKPMTIVDSRCSRMLIKWEEFDDNVCLTSKTAWTPLK